MKLHPLQIGVNPEGNWTPTQHEILEARLEVETLLEQPFIHPDSTEANEMWDLMIKADVIWGWRQIVSRPDLDEELKMHLAKFSLEADLDDYMWQTYTVHGLIPLATSPTGEENEEIYCFSTPKGLLWITGDIDF